MKSLAIALLLYALPLRAATLHIVPHADGAISADAQACFWPARDFTDFVDRFLASGDIRCYAIDEIPVPADGVWNYFVQTRTQISTHPDGIELRGRGAVRTINVELLPGGTLDLTAAGAALRPGEYFAVYVSNEGRNSSQPSVRPIARGATSALIPAGMPVVLLIINDERIVWASRPLVVRSGAILRAPAPSRATRDVVVVVGLDHSMRSDERVAVDGVTPPEVLLIAGSRRLHPIMSLRPAPLFDTSIVVFADVPAGEYMARIEGEQWVPDAARVTVQPESRTSAQPSRRLVTRAAATIDIQWRAIPARTAPREASCSAPTPATAGAAELPTQLVVTHCPFGFGSSSGCVTILDEQVQGESGTRTLSHVTPGDYYVTLRNEATQKRERCVARPARTATVTVSLASGHIAGRITRKGTPVVAIVRFATGATSTDEHGDYDAFVADPPTDRPIVVTPCDTQRDYVELPSEPLQFDDTFDIDIPVNRLTISVINAVTGRSHTRA